MRPTFSSHDAEIARVLPAIIEHAGQMPNPASDLHPSIGSLIDAMIGRLMSVNGNTSLGGYQLSLEGGLVEVRQGALANQGNHIFESVLKAEHSFNFDFPPQYRVVSLISAARRGRARAKLCTMAAIKRAVDAGRIENDVQAVQRLRRLFDAAMVTVGIAQLDFSLELVKASICKAAACRNG